MPCFNSRTNDRIVPTEVVEHGIIDGFLVDMARTLGECLAREREPMRDRCDAFDSLARPSTPVDSFDGTDIENVRTESGLRTMKKAHQ